jgi:hypothetical protein
MKTLRKAWRDAGIVLLLAMAATPFIAAQQPTSNAANRLASSVRGPAPGDAIQVHGHWIIDVRNPDGTLAAHHDFQNALLPSGQQVLSYLVSNASSIVTWDLRLRASQLDGSGPCAPNGADTSCYIAGPGSLLPTIMQNGPNVFTTGSFVRTAAGALEISGNITAATAQAIGHVESVAELAGALSLQPFSARELATPIQVAAGQIVYVKVIVTFGEPDTGGGGGGSTLDTDGDGVPDALDPCPNAANPFINGVGYCPATISEINVGNVSAGSHVALTNAVVTGVGASTILITDNGNPGAVLTVQLNALTPPVTGNIVTVLGTVIDPNTLSAVSITVTGSQ